MSNSECKNPRRLRPFKLERYFAEHEFSAPYLLSCSDCEPLALSTVLSWSDDEVSALWQGLHLGYTESQGHPLLRQEISELYAGIQPAQVLVAAPEEAIYLAMNAILRPGDHVVVTFPGYQSLYEIARAIGCEVSLWRPDEGQGWDFGLNRLESLVSDRTRLIVINFPHNPTGSLITAGDLQRIVELARERSAYLFSDEMYRFLEYDEDERLAPACTLYGRAISLGGMPKAFALAGLRIGWLVTSDGHLLKEMATWKDYTTICSSAPSEILAIAALRARDRIVARNLAIIRRNLALLDRFFERQAERMVWTRPRAGSVGLPRLLKLGSAAGFCRDLLRAKGVLLLPGSVSDLAGGHFRVGFGRESMPEALGRLDEYLEESE